jgi:hypothetical protein
MRRLLIAIATASGVASTPTFAEQNTLQRAVIGCLAHTVKAGMVLEMTFLGDGSEKRSATLFCDGQQAKDLFTAMERVSDYDVHGETINRFSGAGVQCAKSPDGYTCVLNIPAAPPFIDALFK